MGRDVFEAWFGKVTLAEITNSIVTLRSPTKFIASHLAANYAARTLRSWQAIEPSITAVRFDHRAVSDADDAPKSGAQEAVR